MLQHVTMISKALSLTVGASLLVRRVALVVALGLPLGFAGCAHKEEIKPSLGRWPSDTPMMGVILLSSACLCAACGVRSLHQGRRRPLRNLMIALVSFVLMMGFLHDGLILMEPLLP
jgi:hypothetical protein